MIPNIKELICIIITKIYNKVRYYKFLSVNIHLFCLIPLNLLDFFAKFYYNLNYLLEYLCQKYFF